MSNTIKDNHSLFSKLLSHSVTLKWLFHWFTFVINCFCWFILSRIALFIFPVLDFEGFIKWHEILESPPRGHLLLYMLLFLAVFLPCLIWVVFWLSFQHDCLHYLLITLLPIGLFIGFSDNFF